MDFARFLERVDLIDLATRAGARFNHPTSHDTRSHCPLHAGADNPTAFSVYQGPDGYPLWKCWTGCDTGGDAIQFYMRWKHVTWKEAVLALADEYRIDLAEVGWGEPRDLEAEERSHKQIDLLTEAARYFYARLRSQEGKTALRYALERGFTRQTIRHARFGFSPSDAGLHDHLQQIGADLGLAREIGLIRADGLDFTANQDGKAASPDGWLIYPHLEGELCVYFSSRAITPPVRMPRPEDKSRNLPGSRRLYKAEVRGKAGQAVTLVEGPADARSLWQLGHSACALCGLGRPDETDLTRLRRRVVYIATDNDPAGEQALDHGKVAKTATAIGPLTMILPAVPTGKDFNDWLRDGMEADSLAAHYKMATAWLEKRMEQAAICPPNELDERMQEIGEMLAALPEGSRPRFYGRARDILGLSRRDIHEAIRKAAQNGSGQVLGSVKDGQLCFMGRPLLNGMIEITHELVMDDGQNLPHVRYTMTGKLVSGQALEPLDIEAEEFDSFKWIPRHWGRGPVLYISRGQYYELARAIQEVSTTARRERVHTYTGWTKINGQRAYLTASGAITPEGLLPDTRVDLGANFLRFYAIPAIPEGEDRFLSAQASLDFLRLGPRNVTAPLWAAVMAAPLTEIAPLYAVLWVYGPTQSGKSTIAHLALTHLGAGFIQGRQYHAPKDWTSTVTDLEGAMFTVKDAPIVIDDFAPQFASATDSREMFKKAHFVIRSVGNRSSRGRARADLSQQVVRVPRGLVIATAENPLMGQSIVGRMIYVPVGKYDFMPTDGKPNPSLNLAQEAAGRGFYAMAYATYVRWLAANWERARKWLLERINQIAAQCREAHPDIQNRLPDYYALLAAAQELALTAFEELGLITHYEMEIENEANRQAILSVVVEQAERIAVESPVRKVFEALGSLLARRKVFLAPRTNGSQASSPPLNAELIGWFDVGDSNAIYLDTNACLMQGRSYWSGLSENLDIMPDAFLRQVVQIAGLARPGKDRVEVSTWVAGKNRRVLALNRSRVVDLYGVDLSNEPAITPDAPNTGAE
jgi:hypothetical protein